MKMHRFLLILLTISLFTVSCEEIDEGYFESIGIINIKADSIIIDDDNNLRLLIKNFNLGSTFKDKDRVIVDYRINSQTPSAGIDRVIDVIGIYKVLYKPVIELTNQIADSIGNDELSVSYIWLKKDYLNLNFYVYGGRQIIHYINLIRYPGAIPTDTVHLEIRHNNNDDNGSYWLDSFVSFDLKSLQNNIKDSVIIHVKAKEYNSRIFEKYFTYKYSTQ